MEKSSQLHVEVSETEKGAAVTAATYWVGGWLDVGVLLDWEQKQNLLLLSRLNLISYVSRMEHSHCIDCGIRKQLMYLLRNNESRSSNNFF